jgi:hypothetical protein
MATFLYFITLCCFGAVFALIYKKTPNPLYRFVLCFHTIIITISAAYHTSIYDDYLKYFSLDPDIFKFYFFKENLGLGNAFENFWVLLKRIAVFSPRLGLKLTILINAMIADIFGIYFYNGFFFASLLQGCIHLLALSIFFKLLSRFKISKNWNFIILVFLSYNLYALGLHGIPLCESMCWFSTACFSFCFFTRQSFLKQFFAALLVGASHKALSIFPLLFYCSILKKNFIKRVLISMPLFLIIIKFIMISHYFIFKKQQSLDQTQKGNSQVILTEEDKQGSVIKKFTFTTIEGIFAPLITRHGLLKIKYSTIIAPILGSLDVSMYILLFYLIAVSTFKKFKSLDADEKRNLIYFCFILIVLIILIGANGQNYLTQVRHRSKLMILLLSLLAFLNKNEQISSIKPISNA